MFQSILVAVDGSTDADAALAQAIDLAEAENARLTLFAAVAMPPVEAYWGGDGAVVAEIATRAETDAQAVLRAAVDRVPDDLPVTTVHASGPPAQAILSEVERGDHDSAIASLEKATEAMKGGQSFLIYPEGTRSPDGRLQEFKRGAVVMAIKAGVPIVPMVCAGAQKVMEKKSLVIRPGVITVEFLEPIDASAYTFEQRDELNKRVRAAMAAALPDDQKPLT